MEIIILKNLNKRLHYKDEKVESSLLHRVMLRIVEWFRKQKIRALNVQRWWKNLKILKGIYSLILFVAGVLHFVRERNFRKIVPESLPFKKGIVLITGVLEVAFAMLLWAKRGQSLVGKLLSFFMVLVFPANINMAVKNNTFYNGKKIHPLFLWMRLPLQIPLILGAIKLTHPSTEKKTK